jgi:hypothetical protein
MVSVESGIASQLAVCIDRNFDLAAAPLSLKANHASGYASFSRYLTREGRRMPTKASRQERTRKLMDGVREVMEAIQFSQEEMERVSRVLTSGITDAEWANLQNEYQLPGQARGVVDDIICGYWEFRTENVFVSQKLPAEIKAAISQCERLRKTITNLRSDRNYFKGVHAY